MKISKRKLDDVQSSNNKNVIAKMIKFGKSWQKSNANKSKFVMLISVGAQGVIDKCELEALLDLLTILQGKNSWHLTIVVADTLQRYNQESYLTDPNEAIECAKAAGDAWINQCEEVIQIYSSRLKIEIKRWNSFIAEDQTEYHEEAIKKVKSIYADTSYKLFKKGVDSHAAGYIKKRFESQDKIKIDNLLQMLSPRVPSYKSTNKFEHFFDFLRKTSVINKETIANAFLVTRETSYSCADIVNDIQELHEVYHKLYALSKEYVLEEIAVFMLQWATQYQCVLYPSKEPLSFYGWKKYFDNALEWYGYAEGTKVYNSINVMSSSIRKILENNTVQFGIAGVESSQEEIKKLRKKRDDLHRALLQIKDENGDFQKKLHENLPESESHSSTSISLGEYADFNSPRKSFLIGSSDFKQAIQEKHLLIDKSLFIKTVLDDASLVRYIARPRRFGKSINLSMLKTFIKLSSNEIEKGKTKALFESFEITKNIYQPYWEQHFAHYPVIHLSFSELNASSVQKLHQSFQTLMRKAYKDHSVVSNSIDPDDKEIYGQILDPKTVFDEIELVDVLYNLTHFVKQHYQVSPYVLIDEYDAPYHKARREGCLQKVIDYMLPILRKALKDNEHLGRAILMGVYIPSMENEPSGLNNISCDTLMDERYAPYFGFTQKEILPFLTPEARNQLSTIEQHYGGYRMNTFLMFNPLSMVNMITDNPILSKPIKYYWHIDCHSQHQTVIKALIKKMPADEREAFSAFAQTISTIKMQPIQTMINLYDIDVCLNEKGKKRNTHIVWSLMLFYGYLTVVEQGNHGYCTITMPNEEAHCFMKAIANELNLVEANERQLSSSSSNRP